MRTRFLLLGMLLMSLLAMSVKAQNPGTYYIYFSDGRVWGYPKEYVKSLNNDGKEYMLTLVNDSVISWQSAQVDRISEEEPQFPQFTAFEFDDKLNDQLYRDVEAVVTSEFVTATVSGIGKWLTPSFEMDKPGAVAYVGGKEQESGVSRLRFADEVVYTLGHPDYKRLSVEKISDEVWSESETGMKEIELTVDMLSTNEPAASNEGFSNLFDGVNTTIFHSRWESAGADVSQPAYISVELPRSVSELQFWYVGRDNVKYDIYEWTIEASNDGYWWDEVIILDESYGLPASRTGYEFTSPTIDLGSEYRYLRFTASRVGHKNYLCLGEFRLYEVTGFISEPELLQPAQYAFQMMPMGREVPVRINWLTDQATSVPRIDIDIDGGEMVSSREYYLDASISFQGNGVWDDYDFQDRVKIKGRGNTSWTGSAYGKNPYRLKFEESQKPFGMKKGKNWNLIPQAQRGSLMTNPVAHKIARMVGLQTANDVVPVELYMNGEYRGSYYFTQKVGMANNSVDFDDESMAALFELDEYDRQFGSAKYNLPVCIKSPEFGEDETLLDYYGVQEEFNRFETAVYNNSNYERFVDVDMLVRYMLVNDLTLNTELGHPKSTFLSREDMGHMTRRYVFGPAWDFDWAYGYEGTSSYCVSAEARDLFSYMNKAGARFYSDILRSSEWVQYRYSQLWEEFVDKHLDELIDFVDEYYAYARSSFVNNSSMWGDGNNYDSNIANMKSWLRNRANYIKGSLTPTTSYAQEPFSYGDLNGDGYITQDDVECMLSSLLEMPNSSVPMEQADADADEKVSVSDLAWLSLLLSDEQVVKAGAKRGARAWTQGEDEDVEETFDVDIDDFIPLCSPEKARARIVGQNVEPDAIDVAIDKGNGQWTMEISLNNSNSYLAYMMDIVLPEGFSVADGNSIRLAPRIENTHQMVGHLLPDNVFRVIGYSTENVSISDDEGELFSLSIGLSQELKKGEYLLSVDNICFVTDNAYEYYPVGVETTIEVVEEKSLQTISLDELPKMTYGDTPFELPQYTDAGLEISYKSDNVSVATITGNKVTVIGAGSADITAEQKGDKNYHAAIPVVRTLIVDKAPLVIAADDIERGFGTNTTYTLSYQGFVNGDTELDLDVLPGVSCDADEVSSMGTYLICLSGGYDDNYSYILRNGVLTIVEASDIEAPIESSGWPANIYDTRGRLVRKQATSFHGLSRGVYIVNNRKMVQR